MTVLCVICCGKFAKPLMQEDSSVCRWCIHRASVEEALGKLTKEHLELRQLVELQQATINSLTNNNGPLADFSREVSSSVVVNTNVQEDRPTAERIPLPADDFQPVRGGARRVRSKPFLPITTHNRFSIPGFENDEEPETLILGDSIVRSQLEEFCGRNYRRRKRFCCPGGRVNNLIENFDDFAGEVTENGRIIVHIGTNEVLNTRSEELLNKYRSLMIKLKTKTKNIIFTGLLPRINARNDFYGKAIYINNSLTNICRQNGIGFFNFWNEFYDKDHLFFKDGLHLNSVGAARFGRLLNNSLSFFQMKRACVSRT